MCKPPFAGGSPSTEPDEGAIGSNVEIVGNRICLQKEGAQWLSGRVLDSRPRSRGFEPHQRHCVVSMSKNINPSYYWLCQGSLVPL